MPEPSGVRYVARYKWPFRLAAILFAAILAALHLSILEMWNEGGWFLGLGVIVAYVFAAAGLLETLVRRTWLTDKGFHQRSMFGQTRFVPYAEVQELVIERDEALVVKYRNNRRLKVHAKEGSPEALIEAARPFLSGNIRVVTV